VAAEKRALKVSFITQSFGDNPYQTLLIDHLRKFNVEVTQMVNSVWFFSDVRDKGINVVHFHDFPGFTRKDRLLRIRLYLYLISQLILLRVSGIKVISTLHNVVNKADNKPIFSLLGAAIIFGLANAIIVHYPCEMDDFSFPINKRKIRMIPHPNYCDFYKNTISREEARSRLDIHNDAFVFAFCGYLAPPKGVLELIKSFEKLSKDNVKLIIAGRANDQKYGEKISRAIQNNKNIIFKNQLIPADDLQIFMNASDCIALPYRVATSSGAVALAMSFGKPCIAPNSGHFKYILDEQGAFLYNAHKDKLGLLTAMEEALRKRHALSAMGKHNLESIKRFDWDDAAEKTSLVYQE